MVCLCVWCGGGRGALPPSPHPLCALTHCVAFYAHAVRVWIRGWWLGDSGGGRGGVSCQDVWPLWWSLAESLVPVWVGPSGVAALDAFWPSGKAPLCALLCPFCKFGLFPTAAAVVPGVGPCGSNCVGWPVPAPALLPNLWLGSLNALCARERLQCAYPLFALFDFHVEWFRNTPCPGVGVGGGRVSSFALL
jgi:hypothetical protein